LPKKDDAAEKAKNQIKRFKEKAKELGVNEDAESFEKIVATVAKTVRTDSSS